MGKCLPALEGYTRKLPRNSVQFAKIPELLRPFVMLTLLPEFICHMICLNFPDKFENRAKEKLASPDLESFPW